MKGEKFVEKLFVLWIVLAVLFTGVTGVHAKTIKVGVVLPFSGALKVYGEPILEGLQFAFSKSGKYKLQIITEDSQGDPSVAVQKSRKLVEKDGVDILVGPVAGHEAEAVAEYANRAKVLTMFAYGGNIHLVGTLCNPYIFLTGHSIWNVSAPAGKWFKQNIADKAVLIGSDYVTGKTILDFFEKEFIKNGGQVLAKIMVPLDTQDFSPYLSQVRAYNPPAIFLGFWGANAINFVKQFDELGLKKLGIKMLGGMGTFTETWVPPMGEAAVGGYDIQHYAEWLDTPANKAFKKGFLEFKPGSKIDVSTVLGFDVGTFIVKGLEKTQGDPSPKKMIPAILSTKVKSPRGLIDFAANHVIRTPVYIRQVQKVNGEIRVIPIVSLGTIETPFGPGGPGGECKMSQP